MTKNRIKELRNSVTPKITLKQLSEKLREKGLSFTDSQLSYYENGTRLPRSKVADDFWEALSDIFQVDIPYLKGDSNFKNNEQIYEIFSVLNTDKEKEVVLSDDEWNELFLRGMQLIENTPVTSVEDIKKFETTVNAVQSIKKNKGISQKDTEEDKLTSLMLPRYEMLSSRYKEKVNDYIEDMLKAQSVVRDDELPF
ncbi:helix-turn-helix domain-containing protein [Lactococcus lactis]|uniref:helix-turn-helix domain-containing protein n=1 Tax=Lactococcus lactis TaxID=1358 RepID=UPI00398F1A8F